MTEETPYKNQPDLERSGKMETEEKPSSRQEMPLRTWQYKCTKDGQTFSSQMELNNHYRAVHGMQAPDQQKENDWSSSSGNEMSDTATEEMTNDSEENTENKKTGAMGAEGSKGKLDETSKDKNWSMKENKDTSNNQNSEYGKSSQNQRQDQYKCQKDGQIFSDQEELDQHNKKIHNLETKELGTELEEDDKTKDNSKENMTGNESKNLGNSESEENWDKKNNEKDWSTEEKIKDTNAQKMEYNKSSQPMQGQYRCQKDGQVFSSKDELNQHNQKAHNMDSEETNTEL
jgi:uncharacterized C2H2 Zn-finger protein